jgi:tryptophan synthase alpha chain
MNLIDEVFGKLREQGKTALIPFLTVGDPDMETTIDIIEQFEQAGADIVELGVPYSDPLADGPVIQRASERALQGQISIRSCMEVAANARARGIELPFVLFTYFNPVLQMGLEAFIEEAAKQHISGLIIPDLPYEESAEMTELAERHHIHLIPLVAPTSAGRIASIVNRARGFIYCVSSLGVTGVRSSFHEGIESFIADVKKGTDLPVVVGFGISSSEQVGRFADLCEGVVVGSAIVHQIEQQLPLLKQPDTKAQGLLQIRDFVSQLKKH